MVFDEAPNLDRLPEHRALLGRAVSRFRDDDRVVGLVLGGSLAHGSVDFYSDIDLYVVARNEAFDAVFAEREAAAEIVGTLLFGFDVEPLPGGSRDHNIVTYEGPVKFDFMYYRESELAPGRKWANRFVLKDVHGALEYLVSQSARASPPSPTSEELLALNQRFWTLCWYVFGKIARGELWEALDGIHGIRTLALLPMLDWSADRPHEGYRRLERKVKPQTATRLAATTAPRQREALYAALKAEVGLFRDLRQVVFDRHGVTFDQSAEERIETEINRHWATSVNNEERASP